MGQEERPEKIPIPDPEPEPLRKTPPDRREEYLPEAIPPVQPHVEPDEPWPKKSK